MIVHNLDFDGVNVAIVMRIGIFEVYSNDQKHLGGMGFPKLIFE
jgi:hypothetical protein